MERLHNLPVGQIWLAGQRKSQDGQSVSHILEPVPLTIMLDWGFIFLIIRVTL